VGAFGDRDGEGYRGEAAARCQEAKAMSKTIGSEENHVYVWWRLEEERPTHPRWQTGGWFVSATVRQKYLSTLLKGWWCFGGIVSRHAEIELAVGGEDSMIQIGWSVPWVMRGAVGLRVPRKLLDHWVYQRRELLTVKVGYIGRLLDLSILHGRHDGRHA
jgi:hypothetical protein